MTIACAMICRVCARRIQAEPQVLRPGDLAHVIQAKSIVDPLTPFARVALSQQLSLLVRAISHPASSHKVSASAQTSLPGSTFTLQRTHICNVRLADYISDLLD